MIELLPKIIAYNFFKRFNYPKVLPMILTLSVNDHCNSRCKTCNIWMNNAKEKMKKELSLEEIEKIFCKFSSIYYIVITGGEPFLRNNLAELIKIIFDKTKPKIMTIATNGITTNKIVSCTKKILNFCPNLKLVINLSLDGIGEQHDRIRGIKGNFRATLNSFKELKKIKNSRLIVGFNTVVSRYNVKNLPKIYSFIQELNPDSYVAEVAENRAKLYNQDLLITPEKGNYQSVLDFLIKNSERKKSKVPEVIRKLRKEFYRYLMSNEKLENFEGIASVYIMSNGEVWVSYSKRFVLGNLRDVNYDLKKLWFSKKAGKFRKIMDRKYQTMAANAFYTNLICNPKRILKSITT